ncbi:hexokinase type 2-like [Periplaneta americana]|uniref:hexokinase type 2-like n=1 Tax=Periplaneta americana TaxID=6978 RepID=UPI0037E80E76
MTEVPERVKQICEQLIITEDKAKELMKKFLHDINRGLGAKTHKNSVVKCFITYVQDLPTGKEKGKFLALDLGGTNFRVLCVTLDEGNFKMDSTIFVIPQEIMTGTAKMLFDHIAQCLATFAKDKGLVNEVLPLGFTFSFPLIQQGLTKGILERWTKGFKVSGVIGKDVVQLLEEAIARRGDVKIKICAVLNDTTGTLMSCAWKDQNTKIGLIIGTGTNVCYVEKVENAELFEGDKSKQYVIINTESGAFGDDGSLKFIRTEFDNEVDKHSINAGKQLQEKMISGMYLGELVRLMLLKLAKEKVIFGGNITDKLKKWQVFTTKFVSDIDSDPKGTYTNVKRIMEQEFGYSDLSKEDLEAVRYVNEHWVRRAAHMVSASMATLVNKINEKTITIAIDGSLYRFHPHFHDWMMEYMTPLVNPGIKFDLMLSEDGSGRGAALVAAVAANQK